MSELYAAMAKAFPELEAAIKDKNNPAFRSKYADLGAVIDAIKPTLARHGLFFWQVSHDAPDGACIETVLGHASGSERSLGKLFIPASKKDAHGFGSAVSYARRYALQTAFGIPAEDDDGNAAVKSAPRGQSQSGAFSPEDNLLLQNSEPTGKREPAHSKLKTQVREFVREVNGCGDFDQFVAFVETAEAKTLVADVKEKLPHWFHGWPEQPDGFTPLGELLAKRHSELQALELGKAA